MKPQCFLTVLFCALCAFFTSCSTEVDLFADGEDVPIVYALLDPDADTNFVRLTHTMKANFTFTNTQNPDLANYPGKLDVRLSEFCNGVFIREMVLDTITVYNKEEGTFYAPAQKLYYTAEHLNANTAGKRYSYRLTAELPDRTLTADAPMVGDEHFYIRSTVADFSGGNHASSGNGKALHEIWFLPAENAGIYDINMSFTFFERRTFDGDTLPRTLTWRLGTFYQFFLPQQMHNDAFAVTYYPADLYRELDKCLGNDTLVPGLRRYLDDEPVHVTVTAGDRNLEEYVYFHSMGNSQNAENLTTNIIGGYGVFSTIKTVERGMRLGGTTVPELIDSKWGFKYVGGHLGKTGRP